MLAEHPLESFPYIHDLSRRATSEKTTTPTRGVGGGHVLSIPVAAATRLIADDGTISSEFNDDAVGAERLALDAEDGISLPVCLAMDVMRFLYEASGQKETAGGGVMPALFLNAKPAVGGISVEPRAGGVLRVLFTVTSDAVADTVVRWRKVLHYSTGCPAIFDVLSDREEAQHRALWPAVVAAKAAGKRVQFHRARLVVDGERVAAPAC
ncbi:hypothetical protein FOA52_007717 [Chlamydomonas sp. UWO 241]|nr:hypothetical protein FOA52_007717 [Chlamydomonas sp. UWO 241]